MAGRGLARRVGSDDGTVGATARGGVTRSFDDGSESEGFGVELEKGHMACELFRMKVRKARWSRERRSTFGWNDLTPQPHPTSPAQKSRPPKAPNDRQRTQATTSRNTMSGEYTPCLVQCRCVAVPD